MATFGYARVSTPDQIAGLEEQVRRLKKFCCGPDDDVKQEATSAFSGGKQEIRDELIGYMRKGDCLLVTKLDRLVRRTREILEIDDRLKEKGAHLKILDLSLDTSTPMGRMMITVIAAVAELEIATMKERQAIGIAAAKAKGKYKGRKPISSDKKKQIVEEVVRGSSIKKISSFFEVSRATVYNIMKEAGVERPSPGN